MGLGKTAGISCVSGGMIANILRRCGTTIVFAVVAALFALTGQANAQTYRFNNVQIQGNQRIEAATIAAYTGIERGKPVSAGQLNDAYRRISDSGVFESVELTPRGSTLVISVKGRRNQSRRCFWN